MTGYNLVNEITGCSATVSTWSRFVNAAKVVTGDDDNASDDGPAVKALGTRRILVRQTLAGDI